MKRPPRIGVLALQGAFREHAQMLRRLGAEVVEVRLPEELDGLDGLVIPGGESTTIMRLARLYGLDDAIRGFGGAIFGTCAGMIVLDREHLGLADFDVDRNAYGRQVRSFEADIVLEGEDTPLHGVFIRAPRLREIGGDVEVLGELDGEPVLVRDGRLLLASFHPELTDDSRVHELFLAMVAAEGREGVWLKPDPAPKDDGVWLQPDPAPKDDGVWLQPDPAPKDDGVWLQPDPSTAGGRHVRA